jgi:hypothetical protein
VHSKRWLQWEEKVMSDKDSEGVRRQLQEKTERDCCSRPLEWKEGLETDIRYIVQACLFYSLADASTVGTRHLVFGPASHR